MLSRNNNAQNFNYVIWSNKMIGLTLNNNDYSSSFKYKTIMSNNILKILSNTNDKNLKCNF